MPRILFIIGGTFLTSRGTTIKFPTLILSVPLFLAMLTDRDWFPAILLTIMGRGSSTEGSGVSSRCS